LAAVFSIVGSYAKLIPAIAANNVAKESSSATGALLGGIGNGFKEQVEAPSDPQFNTLANLGAFMTNIVRTWVVVMVISANYGSSSNRQDLCSRQWSQRWLRGRLGTTNSSSTQVQLILFGSRLIRRGGAEITLNMVSSFQSLPPPLSHPESTIHP
jgi:hypothetical protein